jgi:chemotaxis signal transduction protein
MTLRAVESPPRRSVTYRGRAGMTHILCSRHKFAFLVAAASVRGVVSGADVRWQFPSEPGEHARIEYAGRRLSVHESPHEHVGGTGEAASLALIVEAGPRSFAVAADSATGIRDEEILATWRVDDRLGALAPDWIAVHELPQDATTRRMVPELRTTPLGSFPTTIPSGTTRAENGILRENTVPLLAWRSTWPDLWLGAAAPFVREVITDPLLMTLPNAGGGISGLLPWRGRLVPVVDLNALFVELHEPRGTKSPLITETKRPLAAVIETELSAQWLAVTLRTPPRRQSDITNFQPDSDRFSRSSHLLWGTFHREGEWLVLPAWERVLAKLLLDAAPPSELLQRT